MRTRGWWRAGFGVLALGLAGGCLQIDLALDLQPDGAGTMRLVYAMKRQAIAQVGAMQTLARQLDSAGGKTGVVEELDIPVLFDEAAIRQKFKAAAANGIKLEAIELRSRNEWQFVDLKVGFKSLDQLAGMSFFRDCAMQLKKEPGAYRLTLQGPNLGEGGPFPNMSDPATLRNLTPLLAGLDILIRVNTPTDVRQTNSGTSDSRRATWSFNFDKEPRILEMFADSAKSRMIVSFSDEAVFLKEFEKKAEAPDKSAK
jgi:hypothetical protein